MTLDNPASRLLNILERGLNMNPTLSCRDAWCHLLQVNKEDKALLMGRVGKVMSLPTDIVSKLNSIEEIKIERYLHWQDPLDRAFFNLNINSKWNEFTKHIDDHVINYLSMTSDLLSHKCADPIISESSLESILSNTRELIEEVKLSDIPPNIKVFMIKHLHKVCLAVEEYEINGAESISSAVESAFGYGVLNGDSVELAKSNPTSKKFWQNMANIALIVSISTGVQQLTAPITHLLPEIDFSKEVEIIDENKEQGE